ncbi:MAG: efflux RND transporter periplasmic adaptor subunit [Pseudomonadota bacterium]
MRAITIVFLSALVLQGCSKEVAAPAEPVVRPVKLMTVGGGSDRPILELPGSVSAVQEAVIAFEVPGRVAEILVVEGEVVEQGQELAMLDPRDYESSRDSALANRNAAQADYDRYVQARRSNAVTDQDVDLAKRALDVAQAELNTTLKAVEDTVLIAPFSGRIANQYVEGFENVQAKQAVFEVHDESSLEISVSVSERDWARGERDQSPDEVTRTLRPVVRLTALPDVSIPARAKSFATAIDPVTRTYEATFAFDPPAEGNVTPGMTASLVITPPADSPSGPAPLSIPSGAVFSNEQGEPMVWLVQDDMSVTQTAVMIDVIQGDQIVLSGGISFGDTIAISGVHTLTEGMRIRPLQP